VGSVGAAVGSSVAGGSVGSSGSSPPCSAGPREQAASETASISAHSAEISFFISIILSSKIVKYVSKCICSKLFYLFRRDFRASVPQILRFFFWAAPHNCSFGLHRMLSLNYAALPLF